MRFLSIFLFIIATSLGAASSKPMRIVILGDIRSAEYTSGINEKVLKQLFSRIQMHGPEAVFFVGDLTLGLEEFRQRKKAPGRIFGNASEEGDAKEDNLNVFKKHLESFSRIAKEYLGEDTRFYPVIGNRNPVSPEVIQVFRDHFDLTDVASLKPENLAYSVSLQNAHFSVLATGLDPKGNEVLNWLNEDLKTNQDHFRFVMGHEPAFSTTAAAGYFRGIDRDIEKRNRFWNLLKSHKVMAYFCGHENLYDRSNRYGVWQVISGEAGEIESQLYGPLAFHHYILLTIPQFGDTARVQVFDADGYLRDSFVIPGAEIYQLRIS